MLKLFYQLSQVRLDPDLAKVSFLTTCQFYSGLFFVLRFALGWASFICFGNFLLLVKGHPHSSHVAFALVWSSFICFNNSDFFRKGHSHSSHITFALVWTSFICFSNSD